MSWLDNVEGKKVKVKWVGVERREQWTQEVRGAGSERRPIKYKFVKSQNNSINNNICSWPPT